MIKHSIRIVPVPHTTRYEAKFGEPIFNGAPIKSGYIISPDYTFISYNYESETDNDKNYQTFYDVDIIPIFYTQISNNIDIKMKELQTSKEQTGIALRTLQLEAYNEEHYSPYPDEIVLAKKKQSDKYKYVRYIRTILINGCSVYVCSEFDEKNEDHYNYIRKITNNFTK